MLIKIEKKDFNKYVKRLKAVIKDEEKYVEMVEDRFFKLRKEEDEAYLIQINEIGKLAKKKWSFLGFEFNVYSDRKIHEMVSEVNRFRPEGSSDIYVINGNKRLSELNSLLDVFKDTDIKEASLTSDEFDLLRKVRFFDDKKKDKK